MSEHKSSKATARVRVVVEVGAATWGNDCSVQQIYDQAGREAVQKVERLLGTEGKVIGTPEVVAVFTEALRV